MTHPPRPLPGEQPCVECGAPLAGDQHWCVMCGARRASARTDALALLLGPRAESPTPPPTVAAPRRATAANRRRAALPVALATLVGLVVVTGSNVPASLAGSGQPPFTVVLPAQVAAQVVAQAPPAEEPAPVVDDTYEEPPLAETPLADAPVVEAPAATTDPTPTDGDDAPAEDPPADTPAEDESPVRHVFMIVLGSTDVAALARDETAAPYIAGTLAKSGTLLSDYRTVARGALANRIALVSGQGPTQQTLDDCTTFADVRPADALPDGQTGGDGCVYGYETGTFGDQLRALERTWRAYTEPAAGTASRGHASASRTRDAGAGPRALGATAASNGGGPRARAAAACRTDAATTRRNPFLWFRGTLEADDCDEHNVPLSQLERDLRDPDRTPAFSYISSDAQQGSAEADAFLERVVPAIQNSLAYANGGLIVITSDQPPAAAPTPPAPPAATTPTDPVPPPPAATTPAAPPATTPTEPPPVTTPVDPPITTPTTPTTPEDPPPTTTPTTPTTPVDPPADTTPTDPPNLGANAATARAAASPLAAAASAGGPLARSAADGDPDPAAPVQAGPGPSRYANVGDAVAAGAGIPVGALLISPYTPSGRVDRTPANAFTLLRTLSEIFGVDPLGYAAARGVKPLSDRLFSVEP
ncbi:phosphoesterase [Conexibacter sp. CPCC 206217]|uniref:phosphoesterase n=1 Tax=Conexibacter sp. CPCC 206217 TaxID=3064574 RepID=UPI002721B49F|nr:phosphoesterase [Conexibacter sp. CPCC 206217]MDO8212951.1 phosphoesterase [Conexibacter sp. CPCC 206217]